ncbi:S6 family peptidase [Rodentibacter myodis]|uniref:Peptidase S6 domain-containing protein n=1 Tax=Rodentibacter myodis TaxID=1907939 RepID=A0A1V3JJ24_9PAST|nr:S6 family peptidase [Rodentibacter myodis]OOF56437.1 hypothetical protein BKL49_10655 [Rodentibacter myodis]
MRVNPLFYPSFLATFISLALNSHSYASMVRDDIPYQYFRNFAENKGRFFPNAQNIPILDKNGRQVGTMMANISMPDFSAVNRQSGIATLLAPQYVTSVKHNKGYNEIEFGYEGSNPDAHYFPYHIVDRNEHTKYDFHVPRLHKLVTETAPFPLTSISENADGSINASAYQNPARFSQFVRIGSGTQWTRNSQKNQTLLASAYQYLTGGGALKISSSNEHFLLFRSSVFDTTYGTPGDSGSPLFAFDKKRNQWVLMGTQNVYSGENGELNGYA